MFLEKVLNLLEHEALLNCDWRRLAATCAPHVYGMRALVIKVGAIEEAVSDAFDQHERDIVAVGSQRFEQQLALVRGDHRVAEAMHDQERRQARLGVGDGIGSGDAHPSVEDRCSEEGCL